MFCLSSADFFIFWGSRVPISLLLGARSSRLRDRQREERELLVKKAFVEDMQNENCLLSSLLGKDSSYLAVAWNPNMLSSHSNQSDSVSNPPEENIVNSSGCSSLSGELGLYVEAHDELIMANNDLFFDFQVDSGTLACVACGILGFPFMCVIQPSETASLELPLTDGNITNTFPCVNCIHFVMLVNRYSFVVQLS